MNGIRMSVNRISTATVRVDPLKRDRNVYRDTNEYHIEFDRTYNGVVAVDLEYASLSKTEPAISSRNDTLVYRVGTSQRMTTRIPRGEYTVDQLVSELTTLLTADGLGLTVVYDDQTRKLTFSAGSAFTLYILDSTARDVLGMSTPEPIVTSTTSAPYTYSCGASPDTRGVKYVIFRSPDLLDRELGMVDLQTDPQTFVKYPPHVFKNYMQRLRGLRIRVEREDGWLYETDGTNHLLVFTIKYYDDATQPELLADIV